MDGLELFGSSMSMLKLWANLLSTEKLQFAICDGKENFNKKLSRLSITFTQTSLLDSVDFDFELDKHLNFDRNCGPHFRSNYECFEICY